MIGNLKATIPWWGKIGAKLILSRLPFQYGFWQDVGLFRHGRMDSGHHAHQVFYKHAQRAGLRASLTGCTILELGPGDGVSTAVIARSYGARSILVDVGGFATGDLDVYRNLCTILADVGLSPPDLASARTLEEVLVACEATYLTAGLESLRKVGSDSVDLIFSQAVLEHIRRDQFLDTMRECRRVLKSDGVCSHRVDLKDHLGGGLNNLRFSPEVWESKFFAKSGFYTNRIRYREMLELFSCAGFDVTIMDENRWNVLPIARSKLAPAFREMTDDELLVSGFSAVLKPSEWGARLTNG